MAQADDLPNLVRIPFPDASEKTSTKPGRPAGNERGEANAPEPGGGPRRKAWLGGAIADILSAAPTLGLLWAIMKPPYFGFGGKNVGRSRRKKDRSANLLVQLGVVTEDLNRRWYEANSGQVIVDVQRRIRHPASALDGCDARWASGEQRGSF